MPSLTVGPSSTYPTIAQAMLDALPGDSIVLESGYGGEAATVTQSGLTLIADASSLGITLRLGADVGTFTVSGAAPINVLDSVMGASTEDNTITGGSGDNVITVSGGVDAVVGGSGTDRLVVNYAAAGGAVTGDSTSNFTDAGGGRTVTITSGTFEHFTIVTGDFADTITTGDGDDAVDVGDGANTVSSGGGTNSIRGGDGADTFTTLGGDDFMDGGDGANALTSGDGNDTILSGTGADTIVSGGGIDTITVRGGEDTVTGGAEADRLIVDYSAMSTDVTGTLSGTLGIGYSGQIADQADSTVDFSEVESFFITTGSGSDTVMTGGGSDTIDGGSGNDVLDGGDGADTLIGGTGIDQLSGGAGNDTMEVDAAGDLVVEAAGGGIDSVRSTITWTLGAELENLTLLGTAATSGTGNGLTNRITGNGASNFLNGGSGNDSLYGGGDNDTLIGGTGSDRLEGGTGNDSYEVDAAGDVVVEAAGGGADLVRSTITYALAAQVENLTLLGTASINGTGNGLDNRITGNSGNNSLHGSSGNDTLLGGDGNDILSGSTGNDRMEGGTGNDLFLVDATADLVLEVAGGGTADQVNAAITHALGAEVENLLLTGTASINGTGNGLANLLTGNTGANSLYGSSGNDTLAGEAGHDTLRGGVGADELTGGAGNDAFYFANAAESGDAITDFGNLVGNDDHVRISAAGFAGGLVAGTTLAASQFQARADNLAQDADDRFIFRTTDATLWYDSNGTGAGGLTLIADLDPGATVTSADIWLL